MKHSKLAALLAAGSLFLALPLAAQAAPAPAMDISAAKSKLQQLQKQAGPRIKRDASLAACKKSEDIEDQLNKQHAVCMSPNSAPAGSPIAVFNGMSNMALGSYCGQLTFDKCIEKVNSEQTVYCDRAALPLKAAAEAAKKECATAKAECDKATQLHSQKLAQHKELEQKAAKLQQELSAIMHQIATVHAELTAATAEARRQCTIPPKLHLPDAPKPITIQPPTLPKSKHPVTGAPTAPQAVKK